MIVAYGPASYPMLHSHAFMEVMTIAPLVVEYGGHDKHVLIDTAASVLLYLSAKQMSHNADPGLALYVPATHPVHAPPLPLFPVYPALHEHALIVLLPWGDAVFWAHCKQSLLEEEFTCVEYLFATQSVQIAEPLAVLYLPATHPKHGTPF